MEGSAYSVRSRRLLKISSLIVGFVLITGISDAYSYETPVEIDQDQESASQPSQSRQSHDESIEKQTESLDNLGTQDDVVSHASQDQGKHPTSTANRSNRSSDLTLQRNEKRMVIGIDPPDGEPGEPSSQYKFKERHITLSYTGNSSNVIPAGQGFIDVYYDTRFFDTIGNEAFITGGSQSGDAESAHYTVIGSREGRSSTEKIVTLRVDSEINPATSHSISFAPVIRKYSIDEIPRSVKHPVEVQFRNTENDVVSNFASTMYEVKPAEICFGARFSGHTDSYYSDEYDWVVNEKSQRYLSYGDPDHVRNTFKFETSLTGNGARKIGSSKFSIKPRKYRKVNESDGSISLATPILDEKRSEGWSQSEDGTLTYDSSKVKPETSTLAGSIMTPLYLSLPGLELFAINNTQLFRNSYDLRVEIADKSVDLQPARYADHPDEPGYASLAACNKVQSVVFLNQAKPSGATINKYGTAILDRKPYRRDVDRYRSVFYDNESFRRDALINWQISVDMKDAHDYQDFTIIDENMDDSLKYLSITHLDNLPAGVDFSFRVFDEHSKLIYEKDTRSLRWSRRGSNTLELPDDISDTAKRIEISTIGIGNGERPQSLTFVITANVKDPSKPLKVDNLKSMMCNDARLQGIKTHTRQPSGVSTSCLAIRDGGTSQLDLTKTTEMSGLSTLSPGQKAPYSISVSSDLTEDRGSNELEMIDLLPDGLVFDESNPIEFDERFLENFPGARFEILHDYRGSGRDAARITVPEVSYYRVLSGRVARVNAQVENDRFDLKSVENEVFARIGNHKEALDSNQKKVYDSDGSLIDEGPWLRSKASYRVGSNRSLSQSKSIREYAMDGSVSAWSSGSVVETALGAQIDYRIRIANGYEFSRSEIEIYDVFPFVGDMGIPGKRGSSFQNTYDTSRDPVIPDGYEISYYNGPTENLIHEGTRASAYNTMRSLDWDSTPTSHTSAVRILQKAGSRLEDKSKEDFILPFIAGQESLIDNEGDPITSKNDFAINSVYYRDKELTDENGKPQEGLIEGRAVKNTLKHTPIKIVIHKKDTEGSPLQDAEFALQNEKGETVLTATSDENGLVEFTEPKPKGGWKIVETKAPDAYVKSSQEITLSSEQIKNARLNNGGVLDLGEFVNTQDPVRFPLTLPMTGDNPVLTLLVGSGLILLGGSALYLWMNRARIFSTNGGDRSKKH